MEAVGPRGEALAAAGAEAGESWSDSGMALASKTSVELMLLNETCCSKILENLYDGLYIVDRDRVIRYWNKAAEEISGFKAAEVIGKSCADSVLTHVDSSGTDLCRGLCPLAVSLEDGAGRDADVFLHHKDGHRVPVSVRVIPLKDAEGRVIACAELFTDRSDNGSCEARIKELEEMALLDHLTRLANRSGIEREIRLRFEEQKRFGVTFGILFMDIDHFKEVNDSHGHDVGDCVLKFVAETLVKNSRPFDLFGRWGGDEFIGIIRNVGSQQLEELGNRLRILVENSYILVEERRLHVTISIGATWTRDDDSLESLMKRGDSLLYASKRAGRNCMTVGG